MFSLLFLLLSFFVLFPLASRSERQKQDDNPKLNCQLVQGIMQTSLDTHLIYNSFSSKVKKRQLSSLLKQLDPQKLYFLKQQATELGRNIRNFQLGFDENCFYLETYDLYEKQLKNRIRWMEAFLKRKKNGILKKGQTIPNPALTSQWKTSQQELDQEWINRLSSQYWTIRQSKKETDESTRKQLLEIYQTYEKRISSQTEEERHALFLGTFTNSLDPYSAYFGHQESQAMSGLLSNTLSGVGLELIEKNGFIYVNNLLPGGSAAQDGRIHKKDRLVGVDLHDGQGTRDLINIPLDQAVEWIRGEEKTSLTLILLRDLEKTSSKKMKITLKRSKTRLQNSAARGELITLPGSSEKIGLIHIPSFYSDFDCKNPKNEKCPGVSLDLYEILKKWGKEPKGYLIDFRHNSGGSLAECSRLFGLWWPKKTVVMTMDRRQNLTLEKSTSWSQTFEGPVVMLINQHSASAAEIVPAAALDWKTALLIGNKQTFGKQSVQVLKELTTPHPLGLLKITIAQFFSPSGQSYQGQGVPADIEVPSFLDAYEIGEKYNPLALTSHNISPTRDYTLQSKGWITKEIKRKVKERLMKESQTYGTLEEQKKRLKAFQPQPSHIKLGETKNLQPHPSLISFRDTHKQSLFHKKDYQMKIALDSLKILIDMKKKKNP